MKVKELIETLSKLDPETLVVLQKDSEGNGYSPAAGMEEAVYFACNKWCGECPHPEDLKDMDEEELSKGQKAVVLWPVN